MGTLQKLQELFLFFYFIYSVLLDGFGFEDFLSSKNGNIEWMVVYCSWYITNEWLYIVRSYDFCPVLKKILIVEKIKFSLYNMRIQTSIVPKKFTLVRLISGDHQIILLVHCLQYLCKRLLIKKYHCKELWWWWSFVVAWFCSYAVWFMW